MFAVLYERVTTFHPSQLWYWTWQTHYLCTVLPAYATWRTFISI